MNMPLMILGVAGTGLIFGIAVWLSPKMIRAVFPEELHEQMLGMMRIVTIVAIFTAILGLGASVFFATQGT